MRLPRAQVHRRLRRGAAATGVALLGLGAPAALAAPTASISWSPTTPKVGQAVTYDASASAPSAGTTIAGARWYLDTGQVVDGLQTSQTFAYPGLHRVTVAVTDSAGQTNTTSQSFQVAALPKTVFQGASPMTNAIEIRFTGSATNSTFECQVDSGDWTPCTSPYRFSGLAAGVHPISVRETDADGLVEASPATFSGWALAPPVVPAAFTYPAPVPTFVPVPVTTTPRPSTVTVRPPSTVRPPRVTRTRPAAPSGSMLHVHVGPKDVITPDDVRLGIRKSKKYGCEDINPNHPENVSHCGWPQITGMFFNTGETRCDVCPGSPSARLTIKGTPNLNDMLLGGTGNVTIIAGNGNNVLWADRVPGGPKSQTAIISAGDGNNIVYAGPGTNTIKLGRGRNIVHAWQGRGSITCASKKTKVRMMDRSRKRYHVKGCTKVKGY